MVGVFLGLELACVSMFVCYLNLAVEKRLDKSPFCRYSSNVSGCALTTWRALLVYTKRVYYLRFFI